MNSIKTVGQEVSMQTEAFKSQLITWRHHLHMYPETAFEESLTSDYLAQELEIMGLEVERNIGGTGIVASLKCGEGKGCIGLRSDIDAINMQETSNLLYKSKHSGKMHACGHDGHMSTMLGVAKLLSTRKNFNGTVRFVFQPAEEPGRGAPRMIQEGLFEKFPMDEIYGFHNAPFLPEGQLHTKAGGIMASEDNFTIKIKGKGSHASSPHLGIDPMVTAAQIILGLQTISSRTANPLDPVVVSCTEIHTDGVHNAIPTHVEILGDTRSFSPEMQSMIEKCMREICSGISSMNGAQCDVTYTHEFSPTVNWEKCVEVVKSAGQVVFGPDHVNAACQPAMVSEDFSAYLNEIPGCFVFIGSGKNPVASENIPLHNSVYDYNDDILEISAEFFAELIKQRLPI